MFFLRAFLPGELAGTMSCADLCHVGAHYLLYLREG
jgi:hypothetical protein